MKMRKPLLGRMKQLSAGSLLALFVGAGLALAPLALQAQDFQSTQRQALDSVVAVVNDNVIMRSELNDRMAQIEQQAQAQGGNLPRAPSWSGRCLSAW
ncbi:hypothetical protein HORIV_51640 [Vreelandella olivaria]|uniref:SurA N-terminal domain-containing protein n=1 Tax=Vreelandella olivaria TaxID=390919 RepID=A0ABM7GPW6_9GAMM|nr:hypothetical protein HORIV_51640 [Halomonas olivaria]